MPEWFLGRHLGLELTGAERQMLRATEFLIVEALAQPRSSSTATITRATSW